MRYRGIRQQIALNNTKSILYLLASPLLLLAGTYIVLWFITLKDFERASAEFIPVAPLVVVGVAIWFVISYSFNTQMMQAATHSQPLQRRSNMQAYSLIEDLYMSVGVTTPRLYTIETDAPNVFASGISQQTYAATLVRGIINRLTDEELGGVIAHELTHIRNRDVCLPIVTIVFMDIFAAITDIVFHSVISSSFSSSRRKDDKGGGVLVMVVIIIVAAVVYFLSILFRLVPLHSREYMADAEAVEMTHSSLTLANALWKISGHSTLEEVQNDEVKELFIDYKAEDFFTLFVTHPPIEKRIAVFEQY